VEQATDLEEADQVEGPAWHEPAPEAGDG